MADNTNVALPYMASTIKKNGLILVYWNDKTTSERNGRRAEWDAGSLSASRWRWWTAMIQCFLDYRCKQSRAGLMNSTLISIVQRQDEKYISEDCQFPSEIHLYKHLLQYRGLFGISTALNLHIYELICDWFAVNRYIVSILQWFLKDHVTLKTGVMMLKTPLWSQE